MSPVELLREAAKVMRERANAATPGPWEADDSEIYGNPRYEHWVGETLKTADSEHTRADSVFIASWHPDVALAVADWLDYAASTYLPPLAPGAVWGGQEKALTVARAYLAVES